jgi:hypothetical protein
MSRYAPWWLLGATALAAALWLVAREPAARSDSEFRILPAQGELLGSWMGAGSEEPVAGHVMASGEIRKNHAAFGYRNEATGETARIELHHRDAAAKAAARTERFALTVVSGEPSPELLDALSSRLRASESAWTWIEAEAHPTPLWMRPLLHLQLPVAWVLIALMLPCMALAYARAWPALRFLSRGAGMALVGAVVAGAVLRWVVAPHRLIALYTGYDLTSSALALQPIPRYGAGSFALHHLAMQALGADHRSVLWLHAVLGVASLPLWAAAASRLLGRSRAAVLLVWLLALLPTVVVHDTSEANTVPILWWLAGILVLLIDALDKRRPLELTAAILLAGLCMISRPEQLLLVPFVMLAVGFAHGGLAGLRWLLAAGWPAAMAVVFLCLPQAVHVGERAALLKARHSLPLMQSVSFAWVGVVDPLLYPALLWPFTFVAIRERALRGLVVALLASATLAFALTWADLCPANIARVQVLGSVLLMIPVALGIEAGASHLIRGTTRGRALIAGGVALAIAASFVPPWLNAMEQTPEDQEEAFVREALDKLPEQPVQLVRLGYGDVDSTHKGTLVHLYFPDYLFEDRGHRVREARDWRRAPGPEPAFFFLGVRCYTPERPYRESVPARIPLRPVCREMLDLPGAEVVLQRDLVSPGDPRKTGYYGAEAGAPTRLLLLKLPGSR